MLTALLSLSTGALLSPTVAPSVVYGPPPAPANDSLAAPPGLVEIRGGRTKIGIDDDDVEPLIIESNIRRLVGETPQHSVSVEDFYLMVTEVTNEQFEVFVRQAGGKVPRSWGTEALAEGAAEFARLQHEAREAARAAGEEYETQRFDPAKWWDENWHEVEWEVPTDRLTQPVEFIDYGSARAYAEWAGLRLMTEFEFQRAGRKNGDDPYIWGDEWEQENCYTLENAGNLPAAVGSYSGGATDEGVYDLLGNVWEWTSSPYSAYPGYEPIEVQFDRRRRETCLTSWDANQRVVVGGSYKTPRIAARITTRRATERWQATDAMGFRCAATPTPGVDVMTAIVDAIPGSKLPEDVRYQFERTVAMDRWATEPGNSEVEGYRVITGYDHFSFTPVEGVEANGVEPLRMLSHNSGPQHLGILSFTRPIQEPALEPGTYYVAWRGEGERRVRGGSDEAEEGEEAEGVYIEPENPVWSTDVDSLIFYNTDGEAVLAIEHPEEMLDHDRLREGAIALTRWEPTTEEEIEAGLPPHQELRFTVPIPGSSRKGFMLQMLFKLEDGTLETDWRRP